MQVYFELHLNIIQETDDAGKKKKQKQCSITPCLVKTKLLINCVKMYVPWCQGSECKRETRHMHTY